MYVCERAISNPRQHSQELRWCAAHMRPLDTEKLQRKSLMFSAGKRYGKNDNIYIRHDGCLKLGFKFFLIIALILFYKVRR
jgi:hypothetical protein